jgi:hypothetical protein
MSFLSKVGGFFKGTGGKIAAATFGGPLGMMYAAGSWIGDLMGRKAQAADIGAPPQIPDLTDQAVQIARDREMRKNRAGGTSSSFLSGVLGDQGFVSSAVRSMTGR